MLNNPYTDLRGHHQPSNGAIDPDLKRFFDFATTERGPSFPVTESYKKRKVGAPLSSISIITDYPPLHLSLGPSFSPAKIDKDGIIKFIIRQDGSDQRLRWV